MHRGSFPDESLADFDQWMQGNFGVCEDTCHRWRIKHNLTGLDPKTFQKPESSPVSPLPTPPPAPGPSDPSDARNAHIRELEKIAQTAGRTQDRLAARKELARVRGWHRDDVQDQLDKKNSATESEIAKCKRLARELREAMGLSMEGLPPDLVYRISREKALVPLR